MTPTARLGDHPLDLLERVSIAGARGATAALSSLAGKPVHSFFPTVRLIPLEDVPSIVGNPETIIIGVIFEIAGDISGCFMVIFPLEEGLGLIHTLTGLECGFDTDLNEMAMSAICEAGNILASSYLSALEQFSGLSVLPSPPAAAVDMASAVITTAVLPLHEAGSEILFVDVRFGEGSDELGGRMVLIPTIESLPRLLAAVNSRPDQPHG
jgi:chemotaxis protein CheC